MRMRVKKSSRDMGMPPIVMMMFSEKCPSLHTLSIYRTTWIFITGHYNFAFSHLGCVV